MSETILARSEGGVGRLTLNRPELRNAMSPEMMALLNEKLRAMDEDPAIRCIVLDGAGENFVAGGDIKAWSRLQTMTPEERGDDFRVRLRIAQPLIDTLDSLLKPLIVAVRGFSAGAGLCFVLAADFVIADDTAKFLFANIRAALNPDMGVTYWLPRALGERQAIRLALLGGQIDATEARGIGLVDEVVAPEELEPSVAKLTTRLLAMPARAVIETKRLIRLSKHNSVSEQFLAEIEGIAACSGEPDFLEAVAAFGEKRAPRYGGK